MHWCLACCVDGELQCAPSYYLILKRRRERIKYFIQRENNNFIPHVLNLPLQKTLHRCWVLLLAVVPSPYLSQRVLHGAVCCCCWAVRVSPWMACSCWWYVLIHCFCLASSFCVSTCLLGGKLCWTLGTERSQVRSQHSFRVAVHQVGLVCVRRGRFFDGGVVNVPFG